MSNLIDPLSFGKIAVLYGGTNAEREVSLESGASVCQACDQLGLHYVGLDIGADPVRQIEQARPDWVFNILHGAPGESGAISSLLDMLGIRYCSSGAMASSAAMNKLFSKRIWQSNGLSVPDCIAIRHPCTDPLAVIAQAGFTLPLVIKPPCEGSSVGVSIVTDEQSLQEVVLRDLPIYKELMVESFIAGREITVGVLGDQALPTIGIESTEVFYDYQAKYISDGTRFTIPSGLSENVEQQVQSMALAAFTLLNCRIWGRVDFIVDDKDQPYLLEVNTLPGMTSHSLVPKAAQSIDLDFSQLVGTILALAKQFYESDGSESTT